MYKDIPYLLKFLRKISLQLGLFRSFWFDDWKRIIKSIDTVIVFSTNPINTVADIKEINPSLRVIFWYWNPILKKGIKPSDISNSLCEKWSFDKKDCEKYNLHYNTSFYFDNITLPNIALQYDITFVGVDKGRKKDLILLDEKMREKGLNNKFYIVDDNWNKKDHSGINKPINYSEYLKLVSESKAILDFVQEGQTGLTLRPLESMFLNKKLITNDAEIVNQDFYNPNNIFVLGRDSMDKIKEFIDAPFIAVPESVKLRYDVTNWLDRFFIEQ